MALDDLPVPPEQLSKAARLFYDDGFSLAEKRTKLIELADSGNTEARGYLESIQRIQGREQRRTDVEVPEKTPGASGEALETLREAGLEIERRQGGDGGDTS